MGAEPGVKEVGWEGRPTRTSPRASPPPSGSTTRQGTRAWRRTVGQYTARAEASLSVSVHGVTVNCDASPEVSEAPAGRVPDRHMLDADGGQRH